MSIDKIETDSTKRQAVKLKAFTLAEMMVVLGIIGILTLIALPKFMNMANQAYAVEAKKQLQQIHSFQSSYKMLNLTYSDNFEAINFEPPVLKSAGGNAVYTYEIVESGKGSFKAKATAVEDFDDDGNFNVWEIDEKGNPTEVVKD